MVAAPTATCNQLQNRLRQLMRSYHPGTHVLGHRCVFIPPKVERLFGVESASSDFWERTSKFKAPIITSSNRY